MWDAPGARTDSTIGPALVTLAKSMPGQPNMFPAPSSDMKTLMVMASGEVFRTMGPCGFRDMSQRVGLPTASDIGYGSRPGDGPGWKMNLGGSRPSTMAVGPKSAKAGVRGPVVVRPVYAPALVAFGGGPRFNLSISVGGGGGGVAWFPLGPREVYVPTYRASPRYVQNVNVTNTTVNVTNITNVYNNTNVNNVTYMHQTNVGAVTAVSHETFVNARSVGAATVRVNERQLQAAEVQRGVAVAPVRQSIVGAGGSAAVRPSEAVMRRQVVVKESPAAPRVSYERQQQVLSAQPGRVPTPQQMDQLRGSQARQQAPAGKFTPFDRGNQNTPHPDGVPAQQQTNQTRGQQVQQEPAGKFTPPARGNQSAPQPASVPAQQQMNQSRGQQVQQEPAGKFAPPARGNKNKSQPASAPPQHNKPPA